MTNLVSEYEWAHHIGEAPSAMGICAWLVAPETQGSAEQLFTGLNERLREGGLPVRRASCSLMTKHPEVFGQQVIWNVGAAAKSVLRSHDVIESAQYQDSPIAYVRRELKPLRIRLDGEAEDLRYAVCRELPAALRAAWRALSTADSLNTRRAEASLSSIRFGIGLHVGEVMYGNIGTSDRLDFTVIGRAVNEACRVEAMCKELDAPLVATEAFVRHAPNATSQSLGEHALRGVGAKHELFSIAPRG